MYNIDRYMYGVSVTADDSASLNQQNAALLLMTLTATYYVHLRWRSRLETVRLVFLSCYYRSV
jgi:hypothetical protein